MSGQRYERALDLVDDAEALVRQAEQDLDAADGYLARDVAETELRACMQLQDQAMAAAAPVAEHLERAGFEIDEGAQVMRKRPPSANHG